VTVLVLGAALLTLVGQQQAPALKAPLETALPAQLDGNVGENAVLSEAEAQVAGMTDYALKIYSASPSDPAVASIYLGFYEQQSRGRTIHSPRNCLPGSGWEALTSKPETLSLTGGGEMTVNRYVLQNGDMRALVLYWYQGRGRVAHNEYLVKWDLLRDAAVRRRTDEALVRIVIPIRESESAAFALASAAAVDLKEALDAVLPS